MSFEMMEKPRIGQELLDVPMGDMIQQMAFAIAEAQIKLDGNSIEVAKMLGGLSTIYKEDGSISFEDSRVFFGREKVTLAEAIELHNSLSSNDELKGQVNSAIEKVTDPDGSTGKLKIKNAKDANITVFIPSRVSMLELGFTPTFYQFVDTIIEVKISIKFTQSGGSYERTSNRDTNTTGKARGLKQLFTGGSYKRHVVTSQVNAGHSQKYSYSAEGSSLLRTKLVPIPPPAILEERIRKLIEALDEVVVEDKK